MNLSNAGKFFMSAAAVAVAAAAVAPSAEGAAAFKDVPKSHYAYEAITYMADQKIINGYPDNTYRMNKPVTRSQAAKMIALAIKAEPAQAYKINFKDVPETNGSYDHIRALTQRGLFKNQEEFHPNKPLTRAQMAKLLVLGFNIITDDNDFIKFADVTKSNGAYAYIIAIAELNITTTRPGGQFKPNNHVTRAQMAAFLYRAMEFDEKRKAGKIVYDHKKKAYVDKNPAAKPDPKPEPEPPKPKPEPPKPKPEPPKPKPEPPKPKPEPPKPEPPAPEPSQAAQVIITVNAKRQAADITPLLADPALNKIASARAEDMVKAGELTHSTPTYGNAEETLKRFNYQYIHYGESLGVAYTDAKELVNTWYGIKEHKENVMSPVFTHIGSGTADDTDGTTYWVTLFTKK